MHTHILANAASLQWVVWSTFAALGFLGLLAVVSPKTFEKISSSSSRWVHTERLLAVFDKRVDVDGVVLRHSRLFGFAVLASVFFLAYLYWSYAQVAG